MIFRSIRSLIAGRRSFVFVAVLVVFFVFGSGIFLLASLRTTYPVIYHKKTQATFWPVQSVDTMKYSRDLAREKLYSSAFDAVIEQQVSAIAKTGATHVALATPYDAEFLPILKRWVAAARRHDLKVWYRGNFSGWEGWFDYPRIGRTFHIQKTEKFILEHPELFQDGDIFTSCPECENGGPGDPRMTGDVAGHRAFLIQEYAVVKKSFVSIKKNVVGNYYSMNGDVAKAVMDKATTKALDGVVTIDHYVATADRLVSDIDRLHQQSGGRVVLGEFGAPIPDIHGPLSESGQARWIEDALLKLVASEKLEGINYWVNVGGSTALWSDDGTPRKGVQSLTRLYKPFVMSGIVKDDLDRPIVGAHVAGAYANVVSDEYGYFDVPLIQGHESTIEISADGFISQKIPVVTTTNDVYVTLVKEKKSLLDRLLGWLKSYGF